MLARCVVYGKRVDTSGTDSEQLPKLQQKLTADAARLRSTGKIQSAAELDKLSEALTVVANCGQESAKESAAAVKAASRVASTVVQALCNAGDCKEVSTAYDVQVWTNAQRRKRRKSAANLAVLAEEVFTLQVRDRILCLGSLQREQWICRLGISVYVGWASRFAVSMQVRSVGMLSVGARSACGVPVVRTRV